MKNYRCKLKAAYQKKHAAIDKYSSATGGGGGEPGGEWDDADVIAVKGISREVISGDHGSVCVYCVVGAGVVFGNGNGN